MKRIRIQRSVAKGLLVVGMIAAMSTTASAMQAPNNDSPSGKSVGNAASECGIHPRLRNTEHDLCYPQVVEQPAIQEVQFRDTQAPATIPSGFDLEWWMVVMTVAGLAGAAAVSVKLYPGRTGGRDAI